MRPCVYPCPCRPDAQYPQRPPHHGRYRQTSQHANHKPHHDGVCAGESSSWAMLQMIRTQTQSKRSRNWPTASQAFGDPLQYTCQQQGGDHPSAQVGFQPQLSEQHHHHRQPRPSGHPCGTAQRWGALCRPRSHEEKQSSVPDLPHRTRGCRIGRWGRHGHSDSSNLMEKVQTL